MKHVRTIRIVGLVLALTVIMNISKTLAESPGKQSRSLTSDAEIRQMRENIAKYPKAKAIADKIVKAADEWVGRSDRYVWEFIPASDIPRAFNSSFEGCPVHGMEYFKFGNYSWKMDPFGKPWKLVCPVGGEEYPSNDFMAYYKTKDKSLLMGDYADDGWGWRKPGDKYKHWFVAYYCHWLWLNHILPAVENLSIAYEITGDEKYARKAAVMLDRIADFYPSMDHNKQSRYAAEFAPSYTGKIVNLIWETGVIERLAMSYDRVFDALAKDGALVPDDETDSPLAGKPNADIRRNIEQNLLGVGAQCIFDGSIRGNYGMHQSALLAIATILQNDELTKRSCDWVLNNSDGYAATEGFNYALDNLVLREGIAFEAAPGYCLGWSAALSEVGESLDRLGVDIFTNPKFKHMFTAYSQLQVMGRFTPAIGDTGSVTSGATNLPSGMARLAMRKFHDPFFAQYLLDRGIYGENTLGGYEDLKQPVLSQDDLKRAADGALGSFPGSRNLGGYGLGILEAGSGDRKAGIALFYGPTEGGHAHADKLFFELYGFGKKLIPDLGYPQFAAEYKARQAWESNTLSHCTVTVNASRQSDYATGRLYQFAVTPDVKLLDVSAPAVYPGLDEYRRVMLLIGGETEYPYLVDFFIVKGGHSHDYSLHGCDGEFATEGLNLKAQAKGTLAGEDVPFGFLSDDPDLEKPDKTRSFGSYTGAGYSFLYDVKRGKPGGTWSATWTDKDFAIRAIFPGQDVDEAVTAKGNPPKRGGNPDSLDYVLLRNSGPEGLVSRFACVLQPFKPGDEPLGVRRLPSESGDLLEVTGPHGTDLIYLSDSAAIGSGENGGVGERGNGGKGDPNTPSSPTPGGRIEGSIGGLSIAGGCAVVRTDSAHGLKSVFLAGGGRIKQGMLSVQCEGSIAGVVTAYHPRTNEVEVSLSPIRPLSLSPGGTILFGGANYRIETARFKGRKLVIGFGEDTPRVGKLSVDSVDPEGMSVSTKNALYFAKSGCYRDKWLANEGFSVWHRVRDMSGGTVTLKDKAGLAGEFTDKDGDGHITAYLYDVGPGQEFTIPAMCWVGKDSAGKWSMQSSSSAKASLPDGTEFGNG